jgi:hypothetical protein
MAQNPITGKEELAQARANSDGIATQPILDLSVVPAGSNLPTAALASDAGIVAGMIAAGAVTASKLAAGAVVGSAVAPAAVLVTPATDMIRVAVATYDFSVDGGGAPGLITPAKTVSLPSGAIILGAGVRVITKPDGAAHTATIVIGTSAGSAANSIKAGAVAVSDATWNANSTSVAVVPVFTVATFVRMTAAGNITITTAVEALTSGKFDIFVFYVVGSAA